MHNPFKYTLATVIMIMVSTGVGACIYTIVFMLDSFYNGNNIDTVMMTNCAFSMAITWSLFWVFIGKADRLLAWPYALATGIDFFFVGVFFAITEKYYYTGVYMMLLVLVICCIYMIVGAINEKV